MAIGAIAYVIWGAAFLIPFIRAQASYKRAAEQAEEKTDQWIRRPAADPSLEAQRRELVRRFWRYVVFNTIGVLALVAWMLYVFNR